MKRTMLLVAAAAILGWLARGVRVTPNVAPSPVHVAPAPPEAAMPQARSIAHADIPLASGGKRNLFAYVGRASARPAVSIGRAEARPTFVEVPPPAPVLPEARPPFPYRFIGTFGTRDKRFAAFTRDGEVIAVRAGRTMGSDYVLRSIGIESVDVQRVADGEAVQRVALGDSR